MGDGEGAWAADKRVVDCEVSVAALLQRLVVRRDERRRPGWHARVAEHAVGRRFVRFVRMWPLCALPHSAGFVRLAQSSMLNLMSRCLPVTPVWRREGAAPARGDTLLSQSSDRQFPSVKSRLQVVCCRRRCCMPPLLLPPAPQLAATHRRRRSLRASHHERGAGPQRPGWKERIVQPLQNFPLWFQG